MWRYYWELGEYELRELPRYVRRKSLSIDVGGNIGVYTYHLARLSKAVITFEPNPDYVDRIERLGVRKSRIEQVALSDSSGVAELRIPIVRGGEDAGMASLSKHAVPDEECSRAISVKLARLDDYGLADVGFIKIDVEGHEEGVLAGAMATINRDRPNLLIEIEERHNPGGLERIVGVLKDAGYAGFFFLNGEKRPVTDFRADVHQVVANLSAEGIHNRRALPYINNFLFVG
jgi:FkbM family methyltransferase